MNARRTMMLMVAAAGAALGAGRGASAQLAVDDAVGCQGRLDFSNVPVNGVYDLEFRLYDDPVAGNQVGPTIIVEDLEIKGGLFGVRLNFGRVFGQSRRWIGVATRPGASTGAFEAVPGRTEFLAAPYALTALGPWTVQGNGLTYTGGTVGVLRLPSPADALYVGSGSGSAVRAESALSSAYLARGAEAVYGVGTGSASPAARFENTGGGTAVRAVSSIPAGGFGAVGSAAVQAMGGPFDGATGETSATGKSGVKGTTTVAGGVGGTFENLQGGTALRAVSQIPTGSFGLVGSAALDAQGNQFDGAVGSSLGGGRAGVRGRSSSASGFGGAFENTGGGVGVYATSNGGGLGGPAVIAANTNAAGIAVWAQTNSADTTLVVSRAGQGDAVRVFTPNSANASFVVSSIGDVVVDADNRYTFDTPATPGLAPGPLWPKLRFGGTGSGEWICSERRNGNTQFQYGLNFYTNFFPAMTIASSGQCYNRFGTWSVYSDARLKKNVAPLEGALDRLLSLRGVSFEYADPDRVRAAPGVRMGFIAQEVERVFPAWIAEEGGYKTVTAQGFDALTVEALRELRDRAERAVADLRAENEALRARVERLETLVESLVKAH